VPDIRRGFQTVIIDAGHGGHDRGGIDGQVIAEKEDCGSIRRCGLGGTFAPIGLSNRHDTA